MTELVNIITDYAPISSNHRSGYKMTANRGVTVHETGNFGKGANALAHRNYYHRLCKTNDAAQEIGYTGFVDDKIAYLVQPLDEVAWTCGKREGNNTTCSIEICENPECNFDIARDNGAYFAAWILWKKGHTQVIDGMQDKINGNLWQHYSWTGKNCPQQIRARGLWGEFVKSTAKYLAAFCGKPAVTTTTPTAKPKLYRIICDELNVRSAPGTQSKIVTVVHKNEVYTIVATQTVGTTPWGKLKSGVGWISLGEKYARCVQ